MSDCSTQAMMPKKRRTCGTCAHCEPSEWYCDSKESEITFLVDVDDVDIPCDGRGYQRRTDGLEERYERIAQVAREMLRYARIRLSEHWTKEDAKACKAYEDELRALGVSVETSNYDALLGSPELAALTMHRLVHDDGYAHLLGIDGCETVMDMLRWLREEDEDDDDD